MAHKPGEIWAATLPEDTKPRPVMVVSREELNRGDTVAVIPFTSQRLDERRDRPNCVPFACGEANLDRECVAQADQIQRLFTFELESQIGVVPVEKMAEVVAALGYALAASCEPE